MNPNRVEVNERPCMNITFRTTFPPFDGHVWKHKLIIINPMYVTINKLTKIQLSWKTSWRGWKTQWRGFGSQKKIKGCDFALSWSTQHQNRDLNRWIRKFRSNMSTINAILDLLLCMTVRSQCVNVQHLHWKIFYCMVATSFTCKEDFSASHGIRGERNDFVQAHL